MKMVTHKHTYTPIFIAALFTITKVWKLPKCPLINERTKSEVGAHARVHTGVLFSHKKGHPASVTTRTHLEDITLNEMSQTRKDNHPSISLTCIT